MAPVKTGVICIFGKPSPGTIGGDYKTSVIPESTGKPSSLKKNFGSWKVKRKLRVITPPEKKSGRNSQKGASDERGTRLRKMR